MASNKPQPAEIGNPEYVVARQPVYVFIPSRHAMVLHQYPTERLVLRAMTITMDMDMNVDVDLSFLYRLRSKPTVMQGLTGRNEGTHAKMDAVPYLPSLVVPHGFDRRSRYFYYIINKLGPSQSAVPVKIGFIGVKTLSQVPEVEFAIDPKFWDKGYAVEALQCFTKAWFGLPRYQQAQVDETAGRPERLFAVTTSLDDKCQHVLERAGFRQYYRVNRQGEGFDWVCLCLERKDVQA
ncbi:GNAT family N-acetyltransferase [Aspergillus stella-maris]|uniref:GNAT family N-acetyltransferase n=1 Tax=Aspergillus stella-maris TaxID=1810926 RepID=UPI003CCE5180